MSNHEIQGELFGFEQIKAESEALLASAEPVPFIDIPPRYTEEELERAFLDLGQTWNVKELKRACLQALKNREWDRSQHG